MTGASRAAREPSDNPNVYVYHTTRSLTDEVIDVRGPEGVRAMAGIAKATANRYRVRIHRERDVDWEDLLPRADAAVLAAIGAARLETCPDADDDYRRFALAGPPRERKLVFEGVRAAAADPLAAALFAIDGVAEAIVEGGEVTVRKGRLFDWTALERPIIMVLGLAKEGERDG